MKIFPERVKNHLHSSPLISQNPDNWDKMLPSLHWTPVLTLSRARLWNNNKSGAANEFEPWSASLLSASLQFTLKSFPLTPKRSKSQSLLNSDLSADFTNVLSVIEFAFLVNGPGLWSLKLFLSLPPSVAEGRGGRPGPHSRRDPRVPDLRDPPQRLGFCWAGRQRQRESLQGEPRRPRHLRQVHHQRRSRLQGTTPAAISERACRGCRTEYQNGLSKRHLEVASNKKKQNVFWLFFFISHAH